VVSARQAESVHAALDRLTALERQLDALRAPAAPAAPAATPANTGQPSR